MKKILLFVLYRIVFYRCSKKVTLVGKNQKFYRSTRIILMHGSKSSDITILNNARIHGVLQSCNGGKIYLGKYSQIGPNSKIRSLNSISIGDYTVIAQNVTIVDNNNHPINPVDRKIMQQTSEGSYERSWIPSDSKSIIIGENVWIGENVRVCKGVTIGDNAIIGANSVVTKDIPTNTIAAGNPAKIVKIDIDKNTVSKFSVNE